MRSLKTHYIILIHGIAGKKEDFGHLIPALMVHLNQQDPHYKYIVYPWSYQTLDDSLSTKEFSQDLTNFLACNIKLNKHDKISFITHSQGAIIFFLWLNSALKKNCPIAKKVDAVINLAPPFWGTKIAEFGVTVKKIWEFAGLGSSLPFGKKQLRELSYGSDTINHLRNIFINEKVLQKHLAKKIRVLTIAGKAQVMNILAPFSAGKKEFEDDSAVPLSSTRCGFYYSAVNKGTIEHSQRLIEYGNYRILEALHLSPTPNKVFGIAQITSATIYDRTKHPSYQLIESHILNRPLPDHLNDFSRCSSFLIDIQANGPIKIHFSNLQNEDLDRNEIILANFLEPYSQGQTTKGDFHRYYFSGTLLQKSSNNQLKESVLLANISSQKQKFAIEIKVRATYSSFIDIVL